MKVDQIRVYLSENFRRISDLFSSNKLWRYGILSGLVLLAGLFIIFNNFAHKANEEVHDSHEHGEGGEEDGHAGHDDHGEEGGEERRIEISEIAQELAGIELEKSGKKRVQSTVKLNGRIFPNQNKLAQIVSRYPGLVKKVFKSLGDSVRAQETLASVEANGSLSVFPIKSKIAGTVIMKEIVPGEFVSDKEILFEVSDLSTVWVNLNISEQDFGKIKEGQKVFIRMWDHDEVIETNLTYVSPMIHPDSQTLLARAEIENKDGYWRPGSFVTAEVVVDEKDVDVALKEDSIQLIEEKPVVFVRINEDLFEVRNVTLGIQGRGMVEVIDGLKANEQYVVKKSFALKAELLKSLAGHDHGH